MGSTPTLLAQDVLSLVHHVILPPQLPQREDDAAVAHETVLLNCVSDALERFASSDAAAKEAITAAQCAVRRLCSVRDDGGFINMGKLQDAFRNLVRHGTTLI